jgi:hypothetical protein
VPGFIACQAFRDVDLAADLVVARGARDANIERIGKNERPALAGLLPMELAGLEPATSWVRSTGSSG